MKLQITIEKTMFSYAAALNHMLSLDCYMSEPYVFDFDGIRPHIETLPVFDNEQTALDWLKDTFERENPDNWRLCYVDDKASLTGYLDTLNKGCCGFADKDCIIAGRLAVVGCNYGH